MRSLSAMYRWLVLALIIAGTMGFALPAAALTNTDWTKRAYSDVLLRDPTAQELGSAVAALNGGATRFQVAYGLLSSQEYYHDLLGANPILPGWFQVLLGRNPSPQEVSYFDCLRAQHVQDELIIDALISGQTILGACQPPTQTFAEYQARAIANNPGLAMCGRDAVVIDQIYIDLLGRHATPAELLATVNDTLELILDPQSNATTTDEYRGKVVNGAFLRFLRRLPHTTPGTSPDPNKSEFVYYRDVLAAQQAIPANLGDEALAALLMATPEYDGATGLTIGAAFILGNFIPPVLANPLVVAMNQTVLRLSQQVLSQQQTIAALVIADFGGAVTADAASAELGVAADKIAQVRAILGSRCPRGAGCALLQHAEETLQAGYRALAAGDTRAAAFDAQRAYHEATLALRIGRV